MLSASMGLQLHAAAAAPAVATSKYVAINPARLLDTRSGVGAGVGKVGAGSTLSAAFPPAQQQLFST
jgi:hypothetical protein